MSIRGYWLAFVIGVTAGAAVALLSAPQSGAQTRKKLKGHLDHAGDYLDDATDYLKTQADRVGSAAQSAVQKGKEQVGAASDAASDYASSAMKSAKTLI